VEDLLQIILGSDGRGHGFGHRRLLGDFDKVDKRLWENST
jgi:hypothetical protein